MNFGTDISPIGVTASQKRNIRSGKEYDSLFGSPKYEDPVRHNKMDVDRTLEIMSDIAQKHKHQTRALSELLYDPCVKQFAKNIWKFVYNHIQYELDKKGVEELRTPIRTWADRKRGVDCDCMSIFISTILLNKNIPHFFRITKYNTSRWQHVYVVIPYKGEEIILDTVMDEFNSEKQYSEKKDFNPLTGKPLSNLDELGQLSNTNTNKNENKMVTWIKANPVTMAAIAIIAGSVGYVTYDAMSKKTKSKTASKKGKTKSLK